MAKYDNHINEIFTSVNNSPIDPNKIGRLLGDSIIIIKHLQDIVRSYNPDDAIFDDEKKKIG